MNSSSGAQAISSSTQRKSANQNIQAYVRVRPINARERSLRSLEVVDVVSPREIVTRHSYDSKLTKKFTFDRAFGPESRQVDVYKTVVAPLIEEVIAGYNCTVFAYGQTGTGKTHTMVGTACPELGSSWEDNTEVGIIPRALSHLFDDLRLMDVEFSMRISYLEIYNEELCDLLSNDDSTKIRIFDDTTKKGSVIIQGLEEIPVHSKDDVYKLLEKGTERRKTATTLMNAQSSRSHTVFSIIVHIRESGLDGEEMLKLGKLNLVDLAGSENATKAGNEKGIRTREAVNINQSLLTLGRVITALVERTPHVPYRESKLTRLLQESLGGRTKTSIIATISPGHKDIEETLSTLLYADRAKNIQNKPEVNQKLAKRTVLKEYTDEIDKLKRDLMAAREKNGIYLPEEAYFELNYKVDAQNRELNEKVLLIKALKEEMQNKEKLFTEVSLNLVQKSAILEKTEKSLEHTKGALLQTKKELNTTKRRYEEKKTLLDSHVKTEKILTDQAQQILEVADGATVDSEKLHHTIERRKDVEREIEKTCDQFVERMRDNFEIVENTLDEFQRQHKQKIKMINEEFDTGIKTHSQLLGITRKKITEIRSDLKASTNEVLSLEEKYVDKFGSLSSEQMNVLKELFADLRHIHSEQNAEVVKVLNDVLANEENQVTAIEELQANVLSTVEQSRKDINGYIHELKDDRTKCIEMIKKCVAENEKMRKHFEEDRLQMEEEKSIVDSMVQRMTECVAKRTARTENSSKLLLELNKYYKSVNENFELNAEKSTSFEQKYISSTDLAKSKLAENTSQVLARVVTNKTELSQLRNNCETFDEEHKRKLDDAVEVLVKNHSAVGTLLKEEQTAKATACERQETKLNEACTAIEMEAVKYTQLLTNQITRASSYTVDLQDSITDYANGLKNQLKNCSTDVDNFRKSELKMYTPTGATPSKRTYTYPRVLAATSPHNKIVKRLRQANDWSDFDATIGIDEESEIEIEDENLTANSKILDSESIMNSTPLNEQLQNSNQNRSAARNLQSSQKNNRLNTPNLLTPQLPDTSKHISDKENFVDA